VNNAVEPCLHLCLCRLYTCEFYTTKASTLLIEAVNSYFHLYGCGYHHIRIVEVPLTADTSVIVDGVVEMYLGYYG
jgi:hypothetical protein